MDESVCGASVAGGSHLGAATNSLVPTQTQGLGKTLDGARGRHGLCGQRWRPHVLGDSSSGLHHLWGHVVVAQRLEEHSSKLVEVHLGGNVIK